MRHLFGVFLGGVSCCAVAMRILPEGVRAALQLALPAATRLLRLAQRLRALVGVQDQQRPQLRQ